MSKHATDRLALIVGVLLLGLGLVDLADTANLVDAGAWLLIPAVLLIGLAGIAWSLMSIRPRAEHPSGDELPVDPQ